MNYLKSLREFHERAGDIIPRPINNLKRERKHLLEEEFKELNNATSRDNYLHECIDLLYLIYGNLVLAGFTESEVEDNFNEIHLANMRKFYTNPVDGSKRVHFDSDGKIVKPKDFVPAEVKSMNDGFLIVYEFDLNKFAIINEDSYIREKANLQDRYYSITIDSKIAKTLIGNTEAVFYGKDRYIWYLLFSKEAGIYNALNECLENYNSDNPDTTLNILINLVNNHKQFNKI